jgi:hypothetical protein
MNRLLFALHVLQRFLWLFFHIIPVIPVMLLKNKNILFFIDDGYPNGFCISSMWMERGTFFYYQYRFNITMPCQKISIVVGCKAYLDLVMTHIPYLELDDEDSCIMNEMKWKYLRQ